MSRIAKAPIKIPAGVTVTVEGQNVTVKGAKASLTLVVPTEVSLEQVEGQLNIASASIVAHKALAGTIRARLANLVNGVTKGFEKKLTLIGVGYRAQAQGKKLALTLGFSHPVEFIAPEGITIETPTQTEILVKGADRHMVGQVAANIRAYRSPEPYKGKGVRYSTEKVEIKEAKKK
jgi:large subunit ribosomal protein L6